MSFLKKREEFKLQSKKKRKEFYFKILVVGFEFLTIIIPFFLLLTPIWWIHLIVSPRFQMIAFFLFALPSFYFFKKKTHRNPFFVFPFIASFMLAIINSNWQFFLKDFILLIGFIEMCLGLFRSHHDWQKVLLALNWTNFFINFFECESYWRICVISMCPLIIPLGWFICTYHAW